MSSPKTRQGEGGIDDDVRIVTGDFQGSPRGIDALAAVFLGVGARSIHDEPVTAHRGPSKSGPIVRIARDRLLQQTERFRDFSCRRPDQRMSAQIEIVSRQVGRRATGRACNFRHLEGGLDDAGDARSHLVL